MPHRQKIIGLVRVSTRKQQQSGLGLEAQEAAIETYRQNTGANLLKTYVEVESGKHEDIESRPQLVAAVTHAKRAGAKLVVAKHDRAARTLVMYAYIKKSGVPFVACDNPNVNELTADILMAVAADERRRISQRTREALGAYKANRRVSKRIRGMYPDGVPEEVTEATAGKLGAELPQCRNLSDEGRRRGIAQSARVRRKRAIEAYADVAGDVRKWKAEGLSLRAIARLLDQEKPEPKGWSPTKVWRILDRIKTG
jgi:DNA invertase Pin-like site-specific DNA recombinase